MVEAVQTAHDTVADAVKLGVSYKSLAELAFQKLEEAGFPKETRDGVPVGMIHGLGHGVGLEIHEDPKVNQKSDELI